MERVQSEDQAGREGKTTVARVPPGKDHDQGRGRRNPE